MADHQDAVLSRTSSKLTRVELVVAELKGQIIQGVLAPGERLVELTLTEQLKVGRSTVREALQRLALIGFLVGESHRGYAVREFSDSDAVGVGEVFAILERRAAKTVERPLLEDIAASMRIAAEEMRSLELPRDIQRLCELDRIFHGHFVASSKSPWIQDAWRRQGPLLDVMVIPLLRSGAGGTGQHQCERHLALLDAIESADQRQLQHAIDVHYRQFDEISSFTTDVV